MMPFLFTVFGANHGRGADKNRLDTSSRFPRVAFAFTHSHEESAHLSLFRWASLSVSFNKTPLHLHLMWPLL